MARFTLFDFTHQLLTASMRVLATRHSFVTANIANADTPGYRPRDLDFASVLRTLTNPDGLPEGLPEGLATGYAGGNITSVISRTVQISRLGSAASEAQVEDLLRPSALFGSPLKDQEAETKLDNNRVNLDRELALLMENSLLYETSLTLLSRKLAGLRFAIGEGRR